MTKDTFIKLFNNQYTFRDEVGEYSIKSILTTLRENGVPKEKRKDKVLDTLIKIEELKERPSVEITGETREVFIDRIVKLLIDKGQKYRDSYADMTPAKLESFKINKQKWPQIFEKIQELPQKPAPKGTSAESKKKWFWVPTRCRQGHEKYRGREIIQRTNHPYNPSLRIVRFSDGSTITADPGDILSNSEEIVSRMKNYQFGDKQIVVMKGHIPLESRPYDEQFAMLYPEETGVYMI